MSMVRLRVSAYEGSWLEVWKKFTEPGEPGESLRPFYESMETQLVSEGRSVGTGMVSGAQEMEIKSGKSPGIHLLKNCSMEF